MNFSLDHIDNPVTRNVLTFLLSHRERLLQDTQVFYASGETTPYASLGKIFSVTEYQEAVSDGTPRAQSIKQSFERMEIYPAHVVDWMSDQIVRLLLPDDEAYVTWVKNYEGWDESANRVMYGWATGDEVGRSSNSWRPLPSVFTPVIDIDSQFYNDESVLAALDVFNDDYSCSDIYTAKFESWDKIVALLVSPEKRLDFIDAYEHDNNGVKRYTWYQAFVPNSRTCDS